MIKGALIGLLVAIIAPLAGFGLGYLIALVGEYFGLFGVWALIGFLIMTVFAIGGAKGAFDDGA